MVTDENTADKGVMDSSCNDEEANSQKKNKL